MTDEERKYSRILAIMYASEAAIKSAEKHDKKRVQKIAIETAYEHIKGVIENVDYCPWQE